MVSHKLIWGCRLDMADSCILCDHLNMLFGRFWRSMRVIQAFRCWVRHAWKYSRFFHWHCVFGTFCELGRELCDHCFELSDSFGVRHHGCSGKVGDFFLKKESGGIMVEMSKVMKKPRRFRNCRRLINWLGHPTILSPPKKRVSTVRATL
jgi:hypothetical protein